MNGTATAMISGNICGPLGFNNPNNPITPIPVYVYIIILVR